MLFSATEDATGLGLHLVYFKFWQSISYLPKLSAISFFSNITLANIELLKSSDSYKLQSQKMSIIFAAMNYYKIGELGIDPSPLASVAELITIQLAQ
jgi:hypothetical protein